VLACWVGMAFWVMLGIGRFRVGNGIGRVKCSVQVGIDTWGMRYDMIG
jgi:hypothetical protein